MALSNRDSSQLLWCRYALINVSSMATMKISSSITLISSLETAYYFHNFNINLSLIRQTPERKNAASNRWPLPSILPDRTFHYFLNPHSPYTRFVDRRTWRPKNLEMFGQLSIGAVVQWSNLPSAAVSLNQFHLILDCTFWQWGITNKQWLKKYRARIEDVSRNHLFQMYKAKSEKLSILVVRQLAWMGREKNRRHILMTIPLWHNLQTERVFSISH